MTIPLDRLKVYPHTGLASGQIAIAVARHQAPSWPSPMVNAYALHRAQLIHQLVDDTDATVVSWGETDGTYPREVVEIVVALGPTIIATLGSVLTGWMFNKRNKKKDESPVDPPVEPPPPPPPPDTRAVLPGASIRRADGATLVLTYRDDLTAKQARDLIDTFMTGAGEKS